MEHAGVKPAMKRMIVTWELSRKRECVSSSCSGKAMWRGYWKQYGTRRSRSIEKDLDVNRNVCSVGPRN